MKMVGGVVSNRLEKQKEGRNVLVFGGRHKANEIISSRVKPPSLSRIGGLAHESDGF